jgi:AcrR family transcriptional regulator
VVEKVLRATAEELGRVGYSALRVEDIATRSSVNKTTIYRRWPTKVDLISAAIRHFTELPTPPDTGSLRADIVALLKYTAAKVQTPAGRGIVRTIQLERVHPEIELVTRQIKAEHWKLRRSVIERGIERGDLPANVDVELLIELMFAPVMRRIAVLHRVADVAYVEKVVDIVLAGARAGAAATTVRAHRKG